MPVADDDDSMTTIAVVAGIASVGEASAVGVELVG